MPFGGKYQATPAEGMVAKIPVLNGESKYATIMTMDLILNLGIWSPFIWSILCSNRSSIQS